MPPTSWALCLSAAAWNGAGCPWAGNVLAWGSRPDGDPWEVGIQDPAHPDESSALVCSLFLEDAFAVTSGSYQRYFEQDGKRYHHIIDPATGYPAESGLLQVTVVAGADAARENDGNPAERAPCAMRFLRRFSLWVRKRPWTSAQPAHMSLI